MLAVLLRPCYCTRRGDARAVMPAMRELRPTRLRIHSSMSRDFVVKHIRNKHGHVLEAERERLQEQVDGSPVAAAAAMRGTCADSTPADVCGRRRAL